MSTSKSARSKSTPKPQAKQSPAAAQEDPKDTPAPEPTPAPEAEPATVEGESEPTPETVEDAKPTPEATPEPAAEAGPEPEPISDPPAGTDLEPVLEEAVQAERAEEVAELADLGPVQDTPLVGTVNPEHRHVLESAGTEVAQQTEVGSEEDAKVVPAENLLQNAPLEAVTQRPADARVVDNEKVQEALAPVGPGLVLPDVTTHAFPDNLPAPGDEVPVPKSAQLDPPAGEDREELEGIVLPTSADASAERLRVTERESFITDSDDNPVDPELVFVPAGEGLQECQVRLIEHTTITAHNRPTRTLALAKGRVVSDATAKQFLAKL